MADTPIPTCQRFFRTGEGVDVYCGLPKSAGIHRNRSLPSYHAFDGDTPTPTAQDWERLGMKWNGLFTELRCRYYDSGHVIDAGLCHNVGREHRTAWEVRLWDPHEGFVWGAFVDTEADAFVLVTALVLLAAGVLSAGAQQ